MLSLNFHGTFIPERHYIADFLDYVAAGKEGSLLEMAEETGIPMGKSSGKMKAIRSYCVGMNLIVMERGSRGGVKRPVFTPFGQVIFEEDKLLSRQFTQWLVHINLCRNDIGAIAWNKVFVEGARILGYRFSRDQLEDYLIYHFGKAKKARIGPLLSTYTNDAGLARSSVLNVDGEMITRNKAPITRDWAIGYSAIIVELMEKYFPNQFQVTITDFASETGLFDICMWSQPDVETLLNVIEGEGYIVVDRQIRPWIIEKRVSSDKIWPNILRRMV